MPQDARDLKGKTGIRRPLFHPGSLHAQALCRLRARVSARDRTSEFRRGSRHRPHRAGNSSDEQVRQGCRQLCRALCTHVLHLRVVRTAVGRFRLAADGALRKVWRNCRVLSISAVSDSYARKAGISVDPIR